MVKEAKRIVLDTEGSGVDWKRNFVCGYVIADGTTSVYVPIRHQGGGNLDPSLRIPESADAGDVELSTFEVALRNEFKERNRRGHLTIGHNIKYDAHMVANVGILLGRNLSCTQINEALLNEYARQYSLEACAERHGVEAKKGQLMYNHLGEIFGVKANRASMENYWRLPGDDPIAVEYAEGDGITTYELYEKQNQLLAEEGLATVYNMERKLIWTVFRMERRGIKVDVDYLYETKQLLEDQLEAAYAKLPEGFNPRSPKWVRQICEDAGQTDWPTTEKGNPSFTEKFLKTFDAGRAIIEVRQQSNLINSFIGPLLEKHVFNGRVHANLNQLKGDTGGTPARFSCQHPNLQQIPKRNYTLAKLFRKAFIADLGYLFYEADYSQCEPRLFAHYSKSPALLEGYNMKPFRDAHSVTAELLGVERDPTAKRMNMGLFTGMYPKTFAQNMGWTLTEATAKRDAWFAIYPEIEHFQKNAEGLLKQRKYVTTLLGRRGRLEHPRYAYRGVSKIIQGSNADIVKWKLLEIDMWLEELGDPLHLLMSVHDSIEWQAPDTPEGKRLSDELMQKMVDVQGEPFNLRVPFVVDADKGKNWSEATFGAEEAA